MALTMQKVLLILAVIIIPLSLFAIAYRCYLQSVKRQERTDIEKSLIVVDDDGSLITDTATVIKPLSNKR